ncbi:DUF4153 domain-containing protein [Neobacillus mesonae]|uniref:DUF4153 domain-containing protein n=1 Tax=Neobacillus mesonae TaxID=1193713 RepID=UPI00203B6AFC|nr:DUF4173 domain-containing protein [Neobacillus mesonae]MCM3568003.1 DUF4173 domain-containing protein [Neobacillus mesonae]
MDIKLGKRDWLFLLACLLLGIMSEESFFRGEIGISYILFLMFFYGVFFFRFRNFGFTHQRMGYLILCVIWLLSASYFLNDNILFHVLNILLIPSLVIFHLVLVTSPKKMLWTQPPFVTYLVSRIIEMFKYLAAFTRNVCIGLNRDADKEKLAVWKKIAIGIVVALPVLFIVLTLLMSADTQFERIIGGIPGWFRVIDAETFTRFIIVLLYTLAFFGFMQVLFLRKMKVIKQEWTGISVHLDAVIAITVLILINAVYVLFTIVQFKYFLGGQLQGDYTFAEYARKGFFELLFVTVINLSILVTALTFVQFTSKMVKYLTQGLLTLLVIVSSVMLYSSSLRLSMYEEAYGFTFTRVLAHAFMIFLTVIFTYTLVKVWIEKLRLFHFYFIALLLFYSVMTLIDVNQLVVEKNIYRYEQTGKIDVHYLNSLSYSGVLGLIELYEGNKNIVDLQKVLQDRKNEALESDYSWQSYNVKREQAFKALQKLDFSFDTDRLTNKNG